MILSLMREEQRLERSVSDARVDGIMCPPLFELVCQALASSGRAPERNYLTLTAMGFVQQRMLVFVQGPGPQAWRL